MPNPSHGSEPREYNDPSLTPEPEIACSFCGKGRTERGMLVKGVAGYICSTCAEIAHDIHLEAARARERPGGCDPKGE